MRTRSGSDRDVVTVILGGGRGARLDPLTRLRSKPAVPIAGKYRLIDVPISNSLNSGMERVFVLTQFNSVSLHRHIAQTYKFDPFSRGFVQILAAQQTPGSERWYQGTADAVRRNLRIVADHRGESVLVLSGDHIYRMDYRDLLETHLSAGADVTLAVQPCAEDEIARLGAARIDADGRVLEFREKPADPAERQGMAAAREFLESRGVGADRPFLGSMGIYMFRKDALEACLDNDLDDFGRHVLPAAVTRFKVHVHLHDGYWRDIGTIRAFYDAHMDLLGASPAFDLGDPEWPFYTNPRWLPGARVSGSRFNRTILAEGCTIDDCTVEDSVVGLRTVMRGVAVRRCLLMGVDAHPPRALPSDPPVGIGEGSLVQDAIVDKNARIGRNVRVVNKAGAQHADGEGWSIRDGIVVIPKNAVIADGTTI